MVLTPKDEQKINILKNKYGLTQTSELIRFVITYMTEHIPKEN
jgi:hypothetical protein